MIVLRAPRLNLAISEICYTFWYPGLASLKGCECTRLQKIFDSSLHNSFLSAKQLSPLRTPMISMHLPGNRIDIAPQFKKVLAHIYRRHIQCSSRYVESSNTSDKTSLSRNVVLRSNLSPVVSRVAVNAEPSTENAARKGRRVNERKRNAKQAKEYAVELIELSPKELRSVAKWVGLSEETVDSIRLAKTLIPSKVKNGWRRQLSYIGGLLRHLDPTLLPAAIKAAKEGAGSDFIPGLHRSEPEDVPLIEEDDGGDEVDGEDEEEAGLASEVAQVTARWVEGLVGGESSVCEEVYALLDPSFDRQELRRLVRTVQNKRESEGQQGSGEGAESGQEQTAEEGGSDVAPKIEGGKGRLDLIKFLSALAQRTIVEKQDGGDTY